MLITTCCTNSALCLAEIKYAALRVKSELPLRLSRKEKKSLPIPLIQFCSYISKVQGQLPCPFAMGNTLNILSIILIFFLPLVSLLAKTRRRIHTHGPPQMGEAVPFVSNAWQFMTNENISKMRVR